MVYASDLSTPAILAGIRSGHVFIDLIGSQNRILTMDATSNGRFAQMGDLLDSPKGAAVTFSLHVTGAEQGSIALIEDGRPVGGLKREGGTKDAETFRVTWTADGHRHWFRPQVSGPGGKLWLLGNPVYIDWSAPPA